MKISGSKCNTYPRPRSFAGHRPNLRHSTVPGTREINRCDKLLAICLGGSSPFETTCRGAVDLRDLGKISLTLFVDYAKHQHYLKKKTVLFGSFQSVVTWYFGHGTVVLSLLFFYTFCNNFTICWLINVLWHYYGTVMVTDNKKLLICYCHEIHTF